MSHGGVDIATDAVSTFGELKSKKSYRYIIYNLSSNPKTIVVDKTSTDGSYDDFIDDLPEGNCRWAVYDFRDDSNASQMVFLSWVPNNAPAKEKMVFVASKATLRRALVGVHSEIQGAGPDDISYETVIEKFSK